MYFDKLLITSFFAASALAQTYTSCNPTENASCPADTGLSSSTYSVDFTQGESSDWTVTAGTITYDDTNGAAFTITESGDAPTIQTNFYIFFGQVSVIMKAATGTGIVSCAILESDDLDEIDWEFLGGNVDEVQTNYFGKGNTTAYDREATYSVDDTQGTWHNYTIVWTEESIKWIIDGALKRTLGYSDAVDGKNFPQTPMNIRIGTWAGGDSTEPEGTIEWAGGETDYEDGPFTMYIQSVEITNYNPASTYTYGDETGDYDSIVLDADGASSSVSASSSSSSDSSTAVSDEASSTATKTTASTEATGDAASAVTGTATTSGMWWTASASVVKAAAASGAADLAIPDSLLRAVTVVGLAMIWQGL